MTWLIALRPPFRMWIWIGLTTVATMFWIVRSVAARGRARAPERHFVRLEPDRIVLGAGDAKRTVRWGDVEEVAVDEDRLVVRLRVDGADDLAIEPRYGGLSLYELDEALRAAHAAGNT